GTEQSRGGYRMKPLLCLFALCGLVAAGCGGEPDSTSDQISVQRSALVTKTNPYGTAPVNVYIGTLNWFGSYYQEAVYQRKSDSDCTFSLLNTGTSLTDSVQVQGS